MTLNESNPGGKPGDAERDPRLDRLYRMAGREDPPARLDAAILAAARREAGARPQPLGRAALRRWQVPVSIAAVVVLSVSLVTLVREEGGGQLAEVPPLPAPAQPPVAEPPPPAPALSERARPRPPATAPGPARAAPQEEARSDEAPATLGGLTDRTAGDTAGPIASQGAGASGEADAAAKSRMEPLRDAPVAAERRAPAPRAVPAEELAAREQAAERSVAPTAAAPASKPLALPRAMAKARKEATTEDAPTPVWQGFEREPPQRWLERISELKRLDRAADAEAMLAEFKRRFPDHPLPPGLP